MDIQTIKKLLTENHDSFTAYMGSLTGEEFVRSKNEKWTAGQHLEHICLSVKPVRQILSLPKFIPKWIWGLANRKSKSYEELVQKYLLKLENGGRSTGRFIPKNVKNENAEKLKATLKKEIETLCQKIDNYKEEELDKYVIPHPLMGKLTVREMLYFTIYHVEHHKKSAKRNLD
ncbi:MAG: DinB family protein [Saprospiraceae bacterium]|nr:DinB family protein [Saprospiraceae bacterium]